MHLGTSGYVWLILSYIFIASCLDDRHSHFNSLLAAGSMSVGWLPY